MGCGSSVQPVDDKKEFATQGESPPDGAALKREHAIGIRRDPIHKDYVFKKQVGKGAFGTVTIAEHRLLKQMRAVKKIPKQLIDKDELQEMITHKEFEMLRSIDHPHVLRVYEMFEDDTACYIVTELMEGGELYDRVIELDFFTEDHAREITNQLVNAVASLHSFNVVHRDIKPENILLHKKEDGKPFIKVCDFGFACVQPKDGMNEAIGTPYYVAPEVLSGKRYDKKCDVWSVGVVVYVMLSGRTPFNADNLAGIAKEIRNCRYTFKYPEFEKCSSTAMDFVRTCLQVDPTVRPSMEGLLQLEWLKHSGSMEVTDEHRNNLCTNLKKFSRGDKFQQGIITFIIANIEMDDEMKTLSRLFRDLDTNGNGRLTSDELMDGLHKVFGVDQTTVDGKVVMESMDVDKDGKIDYTEFLAAVVNHEKLLNEDTLKAVFKVLDMDNSHEISLTELITKLDAAGISKRNDVVWSEIIKNADEDGNKGLNEAEFISIMKKFL